MGGEHDPKDDVAFFAASLERTEKIVVERLGKNLDECLDPGRYMLQLRATNGVYIWVTVGPFVKGTPIQALSDAPSFPMSKEGVQLMELHVRRNVNDRIAAVADSPGGTPILYITRVSYPL